MEPNDPTFSIIANYGYFNFRRLWFGLSYFFFPVWAIVGSHGHFLFRVTQNQLYFIVEPPPASFLASDLLLCFLTGLGCAWLWRARELGADRLAAWFVAAGLLIPGILVSIAIAVIFRYRMEFYPFFEFLALFGLIGLRNKLAARPRSFTWACVAMVTVSIVFSHLFLGLYKIDPGGNPLGVEQSGWAATYRPYLHQTYPSVDRLIGDVIAR
jgi:hypothetical protein